MSDAAGCAVHIRQPITGSADSDRLTVFLTPVSQRYSAALQKKAHRMVSNCIKRCLLAILKVARVIRVTSVRNRGVSEAFSANCFRLFPRVLTNPTRSLPQKHVRFRKLQVSLATAHCIGSSIASRFSAC